MAWNDKRPMSPHLQVYDLPMTAKLSILHRGTGAALMVGLVFLTLVLAAAGGGEESWNSSFVAAIATGFLGKLIMFGLTATLYYHMCNGIRHMMWDFGKGLSLEETEKSTKVVLGATAGLTVVTWLISFVN